MMDDMKKVVKENYGKVIDEYVSNKSETEKNSTIPSFGWDGNLAQIAGIKQGDIVVDLGSGAGRDLFQASELVGPEGRAIGIDFTPSMIITGMRNASDRDLTNVDFRLADIENINVLPDNFADVIISNCVINLTMDKAAVFKETFRILKPGGHLVDVDIIAGDRLPLEITQDPEAWVSCRGGTLTKERYIEEIKTAGLEAVKVKILKDMLYRDHQYHAGIIEAWKPVNSHQK
jgi:ubiquinone/menaquinone biosynthesis C-methylase UbiE